MTRLEPYTSNARSAEGGRSRETFFRGTVPRWICVWTLPSSVVLNVVLSLPGLKRDRVCGERSAENEPRAGGRAEKLREKRAEKTRLLAEEKVCGA